MTERPSAPGRPADPPRSRTDGASTGTALADPAERGRLVVADRAVERIATHVASGVEGVAPSTASGLASLVTRTYPRATARVAGNRASLEVEVAIAWPASLATTTASVRDAVRARVGELVGLEVDKVDVTAARVVHHQSEQPRRVR